MIGDGIFFKSLTAAENAVSDDFKGGGKGYLTQIAAVLKNAFAYLSHGIGEGELSKTAPAEGFVGDDTDRRGNDYLLQVYATAERPFVDLGNEIGDHKLGKSRTFRKSFLVDDGNGGGKLKVGQIFATAEGFLSDLGDGFRDTQARQRHAVFKCIVADGGNIVEGKGHVSAFAEIFFQYSSFYFEIVEIDHVSAPPCSVNGIDF